MTFPQIDWLQTLHYTINHEILISSLIESLLNKDFGYSLFDSKLKIQHNKSCKILGFINRNHISFTDKYTLKSLHHSIPE